MPGTSPPLICTYNEATGVPLHHVLEEMLATAIGRSDWLLTYWSKPVLFSVTARRGWVEPDLHQLPFPKLTAMG